MAGWVCAHKSCKGLPGWETQPGQTGSWALRSPSLELSVPRYHLRILEGNEPGAEEVYLPLDSG